MTSKTIFRLAAAALCLAPAFAGAPAAAQVNKQVPTLTIYGDQKCPTDTEGNEVVVCVRRPAAEQFRIPKELREFKVTPQNEAWAARAAANDSAGASGIGSCSTVGPGGNTGCFLQQSKLNRATNKERKQDQRVIEDSLP
jgi:hypothetical protein